MVHGARSTIGLSLRGTRESRINIEGGEIRLLNDDEILATVQDPKDILHAF